MPQVRGDVLMSQRSVVVAHDPSGLFTAGAQFTMLDLAAGVRRETWPMGIEFTVKGQRAWMLGKVLIRADGCILQADRGGTYVWRELDNE